MWHHLVIISCIAVSVLGQQCPSEVEITALRDKLTGVLVTPEDPGYLKAGEMLMNTIFNSQFGFVLYATSQGDIIQYMKFIREFGLRPSIRSSGHDYIGRSAGDNTYHLSLQIYKEISVNLNDDESDTGASMTTTTGNEWNELYKRADDVRKIVLGGSAKTVTPGGYIQGGGHSPVSPTLGLGVDQVISFTMVNVDAQLMHVNKYGYNITREDGSTEYVADPEVYWAVMGGGGGTFGIIVNYKFKLHEPPADGFVWLTIGFGMMSFGNNRIKELTDKISSVMSEKGDNWGGFIIADSGSLAPILYQGSISFVLLHWGGWEKAQPLVDDMLSWRPEWLSASSVSNFSTFWEYEQNINDPVGYRTIIANKFIQTEDLQNNTNLVNVFEQMMKYDIGIGCTGVIVDGAASLDNPFSSVSPDFRSARISMSCGTGWGNETEDDLYISQFRDFSQHLYRTGKGTYFNEPDYFLEDWKTAYWGSMETYDRLLVVKQKLDPDNIFWCHNCVGSDLVENTTPCPVT